MSVKINTLEIENVKRIKAVQLSPSKNGLTVIGGSNRQGKTSVLDAIAWALGGDSFRPSAPAREGAVGDPKLKVTLDNGIVVERSGKNSSLKVIRHVQYSLIRVEDSSSFSRVFIHLLQRIKCQLQIIGFTDDETDELTGYRINGC